MYLYSSNNLNNYIMEVLLSLVLKNTGMKRVNGTTISQEISTNGNLLDIVCGVKKITRKDWLIEGFKEELMENVNEQLMDELKGYKHSIPRSNKFNMWIESAEVKFEIIKK